VRWRTTKQGKWYLAARASNTDNLTSAERHYAEKATRRAHKCEEHAAYGREVVSGYDLHAYPTQDQEAASLAEGKRQQRDLIAQMEQDGTGTITVERAAEMRAKYGI
jgi:hypothetical protein